MRGVQCTLEELVSSAVSDPVKHGHHVVSPRFHVQFQRPHLRSLDDTLIKIQSSDVIQPIKIPEANYNLALILCFSKLCTLKPGIRYVHLPNCAT